MLLPLRQAMRGARWRQQGAVPLLQHLDRRAQAAFARTGASPYELGTIRDMFRPAVGPGNPRCVRDLLLQSCQDLHHPMLVDLEPVLHLPRRWRSATW